MTPGRPAERSAAVQIDWIEGFVIWQLQQARQKFSPVVQRALTDGPQTVTRHGEKVVVIISVEEYRRLTEKKPRFLEFLMAGPDLSALDLTRDDDLPREVDYAGAADEAVDALRDLRDRGGVDDAVGRLPADGIG